MTVGITHEIRTTVATRCRVLCGVTYVNVPSVKKSEVRIPFCHRVSNVAAIDSLIRDLNPMVLPHSLYQL